MAVNGLGNYNYVNRYDTHHIAKGEKIDEKTDTSKVETESKVETSEKESAPKKAESYKPDMDKVRQMKADLNNNVDAFRKMVLSMIQKQGNHANDAMKSLLEITGVTQEEAQANVADDGYWGVEATANRILDFAKAISGGDPAKIATLKNAVQKGFSEAGKVWGGNLPEISHKTLAKIMEGFDEWEKSSKAE